ncbi:MAG: hypothetical protein M4579_005958 [Chaenotheca gracillima]|nr:MAG: hypothetical protein M4579_005958 [Chaenotheca gracillima]
MTTMASGSRSRTRQIFQSTPRKRKATFASDGNGDAPIFGLHASGSANKRKMTVFEAGESERTAIDLTGSDESVVIEGKGRKKAGSVTPSPKKRGTPGVEKRLRRFRQAPPQSYLERLERVVTQRMFLLDRTVVEDSVDGPEGEFDLAGTTGNVYTVKIGKVPSCTCPDNREKRNQCKHIIYVLVNVLKAPEELQYQLGFLSSELREIFNQAPPPPEANPQESGDDPGHRKPIEGDCPICITDMKPGQGDIVWCQAACGNNVHRQCFEQWATSKPGQEVRCVYCRMPWQGDEDSVKKIYKSRKISKDGYINIASDLGISGSRGRG